MNYAKEYDRLVEQSNRQQEEIEQLRAQLAASQKDAVTQLKAGTLPTPSMTESWHPIETAPKDGTLFIGIDGTQYEVLNQPDRCALGKWRFTDGKWAGHSINFAPTHWMPLLAAPKERA